MNLPIVAVAFVLLCGYVNSAKATGSGWPLLQLTHVTPMSQPQDNLKRQAPNFKDLSGKRFGRLLVLNRSQDIITPRGATNTMWLCLCDCGEQKDVRSACLIHGRTESCGCLLKEKVLVGLRHTHGHAKGGNSPEYATFYGVRRRCLNTLDKRYHRYGGRGIKVCLRWLDGEDGKTPFECFLEDMGERPKPTKIYSIHRVDNDGDYEPSNCVWATQKIQGSATCTNRKLKAFDREQNLHQWAEETGITADAIWSRLKVLKWSVEDAVSRPMRIFKKRKATT